MTVLAVACTSSTASRRPAPPSSAEVSASSSSPAPSVQTPAPTDIATAVRTGSTSGWVLTTDHLYRAVDGGSSWTSTPVPSGTGGVFDAGQFFVGGTAAWVARVSPDGQATVTRVDGDGTSISATLPEREPGSFSVWDGFADDLHGWAVVEEGAAGSPSRVMASDDGGRHWTPLHLPGG
jgi:hypothetical protein